MNRAYLILFISIFFQFAAAFLALRLIWITRKAVAWIFIPAALVLMSLRRCFTLYEWYFGGAEVLPADLSQDLIAMATSVFMAVGVALIAPESRIIILIRSTEVHFPQSLSSTRVPVGAQISEKPPTDDVERFLFMLRFDTKGIFDHLGIDLNVLVTKKNRNSNPRGALNFLL